MIQSLRIQKILCVIIHQNQINPYLNHNLKRAIRIQLQEHQNLIQVDIFYLVSLLFKKEP